MYTKYQCNIYQCIPNTNVMYTNVYQIPMLCIPMYTYIYQCNVYRCIPNTNVMYTNVYLYIQM